MDQPGLRNTNLQQLSDHFFTLYKWRNYTAVTLFLFSITLSLSSLIWHLEGGEKKAERQCCLSHQQFLLGVSNNISNCPNMHLQIKTEGYPGLWGITGVEVCIQACPGVTVPRCTKVRVEVALLCLSDGINRPEDRWKQWQWWAFVCPKERLQSQMFRLHCSEVAQLGFGAKGREWRLL